MNLGGGCIIILFFTNWGASLIAVAPLINGVSLSPLNKICVIYTVVATVLILINIGWQGLKGWSSGTEREGYTINAAPNWYLFLGPLIIILYVIYRWIIGH